MERGTNPDLSAIGDQAMKEMREKGLVLSPEETAATIRDVVQGSDRARIEAGIKTLEDQAGLILESTFNLSAEAAPDKNLIDGLQKSAQMLRDGVDELKGKMDAMDQHLMRIREDLVGAEWGGSMGKPSEYDDSGKRKMVH